MSRAPDGLPATYFGPGNSFVEFLGRAAPGARWPFAGATGATGVIGAAGAAGATGAVGPTGAGAPGAPPTATTIVALTYKDGLVMAGDRRATVGHQIASRDIEKVYPADAWTAIGLAGVAGLSIQLVRLFQLELEHYEKIEGIALSLSGKANRLAAIIAGQLELAMKGLVVVPLLGGWDGAAARIFAFDVTGGSYEERDYAAIGSGAVFAKGSLKKLHNPAASARTAIRTALTALIDAADDDAATAGVDQARDIYPVVARVDARGYSRVPDDELARALERRGEARRARP
ncbi:MAG: proteasome subunit beta [Bifidobacteriaceae bacterium]|jgi:proteasome beta subunit|nr:proteasome subunit beta [Bifidobacteriaceae bacterium]